MLHATQYKVSPKPGETIHIKVDNQVTYYYLRKSGGKVGSFNEMLRPFLLWCQQNRIKVQVSWVPSQEMLANSLS